MRGPWMCMATLCGCRSFHGLSISTLNGTCYVAGQRRYQDNKDAPPQVTTDAWAEAERQLQAGVGIKEVCASPWDNACTARG